ncbi:hypothetical protein VIGAN_01189800 [Vigna angularis var. angularis]|uniref:Uncharacterized protein n=1 Tax=Vigna angularis var. angularis TaxID=157739 RepID=A0A0S3R126_PHAAN|nr:hypothetical protein VIGAN_01189800 [Vigna angularis var. angularis]
MLTLIAWTQYRVCEFAKLNHVRLFEETEKVVGDLQLPEQHRTPVDKSCSFKHVELVGSPFLKNGFDDLQALYSLYTSGSLH